MSLLLMPVALVTVCWLVSLGRTPRAVGWLVFCSFEAAAAVIAMLAITTEHHTGAGELAVGLAALLPLFVGVLLEESSADVKRWRGSPGMLRRLGRGRWRVEVRPSVEGMALYVVRGRSERFIGNADPLADMDGFMEMRVVADQAAETLNALKVEPS